MRLALIAATLSAFSMFGLPASTHAEPGCSATVFWDANYGGAARTLHGTVSYVGNNWNDQISSIIVHRGRWIFYWDANFGGRQMRLGPGEYPFVGRLWNDQISSAQCFPDY